MINNNNNNNNTNFALTQHLVVPGQVIAVSNHTPAADGEAISSSSGDDSFLRGHGTYLERVAGGTQTRLLASVTGTVQRVNKLISVVSVSDTLYNGHVGDLIVGRIRVVGAQRWHVILSDARDASLPLSGVHLPGGVQRLRTAQDAREMRHFLAEGDLISAEVHKVQNDGTLLLHTRSVRYGKLENGCLITVPPVLIARRKNHYTTLLNKFEVLWGCNGMIWMQRIMNATTATSESMNADVAAAAGGGGGQELAELQEQRRREHAEMPYSSSERRNLARLRNAVECFRLTHSMISPDPVEAVYQLSVAWNLSPAEMLLPHNVIRLTESCRQAS